MSHSPLTPAASQAGDPRPIVVTGTGTAVGKTFVSVEVLTWLSSQRFRCLGLKPVETGFLDPTRSDAAALARAAGHALVTPHFTAPQPESPHRAARSLRTPIDVRAIAGWVANQRAITRPDAVVVETAGGLFSPLGDTAVNLDLVRALEPCNFVLVVADRLGALHDALSAVTAARAVHRAPDLICMNVQDDAALQLGNTSELRRLLTDLAVIQAPLARSATSAELRALLLSGGPNETPR